MTDNLPPLPQTDWLLHMPAQGLPDGWRDLLISLTEHASEASDHTDDSFRRGVLHLANRAHKFLAASPHPQPVQPSETDNGISSEDWIEAAMRVYLIAGDTEQEAQECAEYQWGEMDMDDLCDPYEAAMADVEGRGPAPQPKD